MRSFWGYALQIVVMLGLAALSVAIWTWREDVSKYAAEASTLFRTHVSGSSAGNRLEVRPRSPATPVVVARVTTAADTEVVSAIGTALARRAVMLTPDVAGRVARILVEPGAKVTAGQPLMALDDRKAKLAVAIARQGLADAQRALGRVKFLNERKLRSRAPVEDAESVVAQAELVLAQANEGLRDLTIRAPFGGVVGMAKVEIGARVEMATELVTIDDRSELVIEFQAPERFLPQLKVGDRVQASTPSYRARQFSGSIREIESRIDPASRTFTVRAALPNRDDLLRPGMSFRVEIALAGESYASVPELALQWRSADSFVWVVRDSKAERVAVNAIRRLNKSVLVTGEKLQPGMLVVVEGMQRLRPGREVRFEIPDAAKGSTKSIPSPAPDQSDQSHLPKATTPNARG